MPNRAAYIQLFEQSAEVPAATVSQLGTPAEVVGTTMVNVLAEFSRDCPRYKTAASTWAGTAITLADWKSGPTFRSSLSPIESPTGDIPPTFLRSTEYYLNLADGKLSLLTASTGQTYAVRYTILHTMPEGTDSSITEDIRGAYFKLVARDIFTKMAAKHGETRRPDILADTVNYQSKVGEYLRLAKEADRQYRLMLGLPEKPQQRAAAATVDVVVPSSHRLFGPEGPWANQ